MTRLRMSGDKLILPPYALMAWIKKTSNGL
jgi:hypothetical protein